MNFFKRFISRFRRSIHVIFNRSEYAPSGGLRESEIVGAVANAIATNVGKLAPQVIRKDARGVTIKTTVFRGF